jgi:S-DNA-T family DNA segregation ATPase FtsK/SpoIIIE
MPRAGQGIADWLSRLGQPSPSEMRDEEFAEEETATDSRRSRQRKPKVRPEIEALSLRSQTDEAPARPARRAQGLPPLDLLIPPSKDAAGKADARYQAQIIEETLSGFGVPAEVKEINVGPAVTQFGIDPGYVERPRPHPHRSPRARTATRRHRSP